MIERTDLTILGTTTLKNKLGITDPQQLASAEADFTAFRLAELRTAPIRGGFDSVHLQEIHHHVHQDLYDWVGELRRADVGNRLASDVVTSLNAVLDRLGRENHLKGRCPEEWSHSASAYIYIAADLPRPSTILLGADATETHFKHLSLSSTEVIHLALHGYADLDYPDRSALVFAPDPSGSEDGLLQVREIRGLHLKSKLVTLSACNTGVGPVGEAGVCSGTAAACRQSLVVFRDLETERPCVVHTPIGRTEIDVEFYRA